MKLTFTANAQIQVSCNSNPANQICARNKKISINIPVNPVVTVPAGNTGTFPFGDEKQPGSYQGSLQIPTGLCTGAMTLCQTPTLFVTEVCSDVANPPSVSVNWHWRDPYAQQPASPSNNIDCSNPSQNSPSNPNAALCGAAWSAASLFTPHYCPSTTTAQSSTLITTTTTTSLARGSCSNPGAIVGHICAGCPGNSGGDTVGNYSLRITPAVGGVIVTFASVQIFPGKGLLREIYVNWGAPTDTLTKPAGQADFKIDDPLLTYGWGPWCPTCVDPKISFFVPGFSVCEPIQLSIHLNVGTETAFGGAYIQNGRTMLDPGAQPGTVGNQWYYTMLVQDCEACNTPPQCLGQPLCSAPGCRYSGDQAACQSLAAPGCTGTCQSNFQCSFACGTTGATTTSTTKLVTTTVPTTTTTKCTQPCSLCGITFSSGWNPDCSKCFAPPGFKFICQWSPNQGIWEVLQVSNDLVVGFFDTADKQQQNFFAGDFFKNVNGQRVQSDCSCRPISTTTAPTTTAPAVSPPIIPLLNCIQCLGQNCFAYLGYDARNVWPDRESTSNVVTRYPISGVNNYLSTGTTTILTGLPTQFLNQLVPIAFIIEFPKSTTYVWRLDGLSLTFSSATVTQTCDRCDIPALVVANPISIPTMIGVEYRVDLSALPDLCAQQAPRITHFAIDLPACGSLNIAVNPPQCLSTAGTPPSYVTAPNWDPTAVNPSCFYDPMVSPFAIPIASTPECTQFSVHISIDPSLCGHLALGQASMSSLWTEACPSCDTCRITPILALTSTCTGTCGPDFVYSTTECRCVQCELACPAFFQETVGCKCAPCPTSCPQGQYLSPTLCCTPYATTTCSEICDPPPVCPPGSLPTEDLCGCASCPAPSCLSGWQVDSTQCGCVLCDVTCLSNEIVATDGCSCIPVSVKEPSPTDRKSTR